ncbi:MAG TPA: nuclear transport factor 2 family protein [Acidimicrobiales bacterium]|nr:nuclear transport factor 2 family protein [Acidimicrobiales bacterium]
MERSSDLVATTQKFYDSLSAGDAEAATSLVSTADGMLMIGTDPNEWLTDHKILTDLFAAQVSAGVNVRGGEIQAFEEGSVGWIADRAAFILPDGTEVPVRITAVFHKEDGQWRMIQSHASLALSNEEALGVDV